MDDRLVADIGIERQDIARWLRGRADAAPSSPAATRTGGRPFATRLRSPSAAFLRELRADAGREGPLTH